MKNATQKTNLEKAAKTTLKACALRAAYQITYNLAAMEKHFARLNGLCGLARQDKSATAALNDMNDNVMSSC